MDYWISIWRDVHDNAVKTLGSGDWNWVLENLEKFEVTDDKYSAFLFNLTHFDATAKNTGLIVEDRVKGSCHDQRKGEKTVIYRRNSGTFLDPSSFERTGRAPMASKAFEVAADAHRGGDGHLIRGTFDVLAWLKDKGLYLKPLAAGKHSIICPWHHEHSKATKSGTVFVLWAKRDSSCQQEHCRKCRHIPTPLLRHCLDP